MSRERTRMLLVDTRRDQLAEAEADDLPGLLAAGDLVVFNDAATLPASLHGHARGAALEVRLLEGPYAATTRAVLLGSGDYRTPTERRAPPPRLAVGAAIELAGFALTVSDVSALSPRLVELAWPGDRAERFRLLYRAGSPVQYSYVPEPLALWDVQTAFASRPWAVEMPSAARPLHARTLLALARRGIAVASLTHAAGLSATGDARIDAALPLPERYDIPPATVQAIAHCRARGGRLLAIGTSVVRALEDSAHRHGQVRAGEAIAELVLDRACSPRVVAGLLTGIHAPGESHYRLLAAFARARTLARAAAFAEAREYRHHEFGDAALLWPDLAQARTHAA